jgi:hypothetical protein
MPWPALSIVEGSVGPRGRPEIAVSAIRSEVSRQRGTADSGPAEIAPGVFVGGWKDALLFEGVRICVLDEPESGMPADFQLAIYDPGREAAVIPNLDIVAARIQGARATGRKVLVFCGQGVRRGPLAGAWYLHRHLGLSLRTAYDRLRRVRPVVESPDSWIRNRRDLEQ